MAEIKPYVHTIRAFPLLRLEHLMGRQRWTSRTPPESHWHRLQPQSQLLFTPSITGRRWVTPHGSDESGSAPSEHQDFSAFTTFSMLLEWRTDPRRPRRRAAWCWACGGFWKVGAWKSDFPILQVHDTVNVTTKGPTFPPKLDAKEARERECRNTWLKCFFGSWRL